MRINWKYLGFGFILGVVIFGAILFYPLNAGSVHVTVVNAFAKNLNSSSIGFTGSLPGFSTSKSSTYLETFNINVAPGAAAETFMSIGTNTTGFNVTSVSPSLPIKVNGGQSRQFVLHIKVPDSNYTGDVSIIEYYSAPKLVYANVTQVNFFYDNVTSNSIYFAGSLSGFNATSNSSYLYSFTETNAISHWLSFTTNTTGFKVLNTTPSLPLNVTRSEQVFVLKIGTPKSAYDGPISIIGSYK